MESKVLLRVCNVICPDQAYRFYSLSSRRNVTFLCHFDKYYDGNCSGGLSVLVRRRYEFKGTARFATNSQ